MNSTRTPQKILVRAPNWIGDQILAYPCFQYLRAGYPGAQITAVCQPWVASVQFRHLVDAVYVLPQPTGTSVWARARALEAGARALRARGPWDLGLCLPNSFSSAWLFVRAGVRWRRGYATDGRGFLLHDRLAWETHSQQHRAASIRACATGCRASPGPDTKLLGRVDTRRHHAAYVWRWPPVRCAAGLAGRGPDRAAVLPVLGPGAGQHGRVQALASGAVRSAGQTSGAHHRSHRSGGRRHSRGCRCRATLSRSSVPVDGLYGQGAGGGVLAGVAPGPLYRQQRFRAGPCCGALWLACVYRMGRRRSRQNEAVGTRCGPGAVQPC